MGLLLVLDSQIFQKIPNILFFDIHHYTVRHLSYQIFPTIR